MRKNSMNVHELYLVHRFSSSKFMFFYSNADSSRVELRTRSTVFRIEERATLKCRRKVGLGSDWVTNIRRVQITLRISKSLH